MTFDELEAQLSWGLHDARLEALSVDWMGAEVVMRVRVMISERQDSDRLLSVTVTGLAFCAIEPPQEEDPSRGYQLIPAGGLWIDSGAGDGGAEVASRLPSIPPGAFLRWFFVRDWNRFIHICARDVIFAWLEPAARMNGEGPRALFAGDVIAEPGKPKDT